MLRIKFVMAMFLHTQRLIQNILLSIHNFQSTATSVSLRYALF